MAGFSILCNFYSDSAQPCLVGTNGQILGQEKEQSGQWTQVQEQ
jgi:hypothetical protein